MHDHCHRAPNRPPILPVGCALVVWFISGCGEAPRAPEPEATNATATTATVTTVPSGESVELRTTAIVPADQGQSSGEGLIQVRIRYSDPEAGEVVLMWGLDNYRRVPSSLPPGTFLTVNGSHINTPMRRDGDAFVAEFEADANTELSYAFHVTRTSGGDAVDLWKVDKKSNDAYHKSLTVAGADEKAVDPKRYVGKFRSNEWSELHTKAVVSAEGGQGAGEGAIQVRIRYSDPAAGEVVLMWGLDSFQRVPASLPPGTFLTVNGSHINTPMQRDGDVFVAEFEVDSNTELNYAFHVTRTSGGEPADLWKIDQKSNEAYRKSLSVADVDEKVVDPKIYIGKFGSAEWTELRTKAIVPADEGKNSGKGMIQAQIRYSNPEAGEMILVWGLDDFRRAPSKLPPETFLTVHGSHMNTPMRREGNVFVTELEADANTNLNYAFHVTRTASGEPADLWKIDKKSNGDYRRSLTVAGADEKFTDADASKGRFTFDEWSELQTTVVQSENSGTSAEPERILTEVRYRDPAAGAVVLAWGIDDFQRVPSKLPAETLQTIDGKHLNTPMRRDGNVFVAEIELDANTTLNYAFNVTPAQGSDSVQIWKGTGTPDGYYSRKLTAAAARRFVSPKASGNLATGDIRSTPAAGQNVRTARLNGEHPDEYIKVFQKVVLPSKQMIRGQDRGIQVQVRYKNPHAEEVTLIWGLDNYKKKPGSLPPGTFLTQNDSHMNTPMTRQGDMFVVDFSVLKDAELNYVFMITRTSDGEPAKIYRIDKATRKDYVTMLSAENADEVVDPNADVPRDGISVKPIIIGVVVVLIVGWLVFDFMRGRKKSPQPETQGSGASTPRAPKRQVQYRPGGTRPRDKP